MALGTFLLWMSSHQTMRGRFSLVLSLFVTIDGHYLDHLHYLVNQRGPGGFPGGGHSTSHAEKLEFSNINISVSSLTCWG